MLLAAGALRAGAATPSGAAATLSAIDGDTVSDIFVEPSVADNEATVSDPSRAGDVKFDNAVATVRSTIVGTALVGESDVSLSDVSLLGGVVTADSVELVATADTGPASALATASSTASRSTAGRWPTRAGPCWCPASAR